MIQIRPAAERGHFNYGWLDTYHTFSFGDYQDPAHTKFRALRVINEDRIAPAQGFPMHSHTDMEILTCILEGALAHKDSLGNGSTISPGEVQRMSAGTGVTHSEYNASDAEPVHLLQIWIFPDQKGLPPSYEQKKFSRADRQDKLCLLASPEGKKGSVKLHQDVNVYLTEFEKSPSLDVAVGTNRHLWIQTIRGALSIDHIALRAGDGAAVSGKKEVSLKAGKGAEILIFDLA